MTLYIGIKGLALIYTLSGVHGCSLNEHPLSVSGIFTFL